MSSLPTVEDILSPDEELRSLPDVAEALGLPVTHIHQMLRDRQILAVRRNGIVGVPERFFDDGAITRHLPGLLSVLHDGGFSPRESLQWLFTEDDSLPGRPVDALHGHGAREVIRRAQSMAF